MRIFILSAAVTTVALWATTAANAAPPHNHRLDPTFVRADTNKDGFLDVAELARGFRGPNARLVEHKGKVRPRSETHPDHTFLETYDADRDDRISKAEFEIYEQRALAGLQKTNIRNRNYNRNSRTLYRQPYRHRGQFGRRRGMNPYQNQMGLQRAYQQQRQAFYNRVRYGAYSPFIRGGYRGHANHRRGHRGRR